MKLKEWLSFFALSLAWGSSFLFIKIGVQEVGPATLVAYRLLFGAIGLGMVCLLFRPAFPTERRVWLAMALLGFTNTTLPFVLISWGEQHIDSGLAAVLNATVPIFAVVIAHVVLHDENITKWKIAGIVAGFVGVAVLMRRDLGAGQATQNLLGQGAVVLASLAYAGSTVYARKRLIGVPPMVQALVTVTVADILTWMLVMAGEPLRLPQLPITWLSFLWLGLIGSCVAYLLYFYLIQSIGSTRTTMVTYVLPVVGVTLGVVFLDEALDAGLLLGLSLVIGSLWLVNKGY